MNSSYRSNADSAVSITRNTLGKMSCLTLFLSMLAVTILQLVRTLFISLSGKQLDIFESMYYIFGLGSINVVNFVFELILCVICVILTLGIFITYKNALKDDVSLSVTGLNMILYSLMVSVFVEIIYVVISLCSASVIYNGGYAINYGLTNTKSYEYELSAFGLFSRTLWIGSIAITLTIALIRLVLAFKRNLFGTDFSKKGSILTMVSGITAAFASCCTFCWSLFALVFFNDSSERDYLSNDRYSQPKIPDPAVLCINMLNILITAAMSIALITLAVIVGYFIVNMNKSRNKYAYANKMVPYQNLPYGYGRQYPQNMAANTSYYPPVQNTSPGNTVELSSNPVVYHNNPKTQYPQNTEPVPAAEVHLEKEDHSDSQADTQNHTN